MPALKRKLEAAVKAHANRVTGPLCGTCHVGLPFNGYFWNPMEDDGDSARLETAAMLSVIWVKTSDPEAASAVSSVHVFDYMNKAIADASVKDFGGDVDRARRWAVLDMAAKLNGWSEDD